MPAPRKPRPRKARGQKVSQADYYRLGEEVAGLKARTDPKSWRQIVKDAHSRGQTVAGYTGGGPEALRERTQSSLLEQAKKTTATAFDPAKRQLDQTEVRTRALNDKRSADNLAYQQWMQGKIAQHNEQARQAQQQYGQYLQDLQATTVQSAANLQQQAQQTAMAGGVSDPSQSTALGSDLGANVARAGDLVGNARAQTAASLPGVEAMLGANIAQGTAAYQQADGLRAKEFGEQISDVTRGKNELATNKAAALVEEWTRLRNQEIDKANQNRDYGAAAEKLGVEKYKANLSYKKWSDQLKLESSKLSLAERKADDAVAVAAAKTRLGYDQLRASKGRAAADRAVKREIARMREAGLDRRDRAAAKPGAEGRKPASPAAVKASRDAARTVSTALGELRRLNAKPGVDRTKIRERVRANFDDMVIDVAEDLRRNNGKLSPAGLKKARQLGILNATSIAF